MNKPVSLTDVFLLCGGELEKNRLHQDLRGHQLQLMQR